MRVTMDEFYDAKMHKTDVSERRNKLIVIIYNSSVEGAIRDIVLNIHLSSYEYEYGMEIWVRSLITLRRTATF